MSVVNSAARDNLSRIVSALSLAAVCVDDRLYVICSNRAFEEMLGWSQEELQDTLLPGGLELPSLSDNFSARRGLRNKTFRRTLRHRDGGPAHVLISGSELGSSPGDPPTYLLILVNINEQVFAERFLMRDQQFLRILLDHVPHPIFVKSEPDGQFVHWNRACESLFGLKAVDVLGKTDHDFFPAQEAQAFREMDKQVFKGRQTVIIPEEVMTKPSLGRRILRTSKTPIFDEFGNPLMLIGISEDITEKRAEEEEIRRLAEAVHQVSEAITITDTEGVILYVNPAFASISGFAAEEVLGKNPAKLLVEGDNTAQLGDMAATLSRGEVWKGKHSIVRKDGKICETEATVSPVRDGDGNIKYHVTVARDITQMLLLEAQLRQAQKLESVGSLAAGIAHEINTPIQFIGDNLNYLSDCFVQIRDLLKLSRRLAEEPGRESIDELAEQLAALIKRSDLDLLMSDIPEAVSQSLQGVQRVADIVRAMKAFSHPDTRDKAAVDVNGALQTTLVVARNEIKYVAKVETNFAPDLPLVQGYAGELNQVFLNLLINAAHAIDDVVKKSGGGLGTIAVRTWRESDAVLISISDTGSGIDPRIRSRIFDPFFTTKGVGKGTGQGLAIARSAIVDKHGGQIWCESEVGDGTTFFIKLPADPQPVSELLLG